MSANLIDLMRSINDVSLSASAEARRSLARQILAVIDAPSTIENNEWALAAKLETIRKICERP